MKIAIIGCGYVGLSMAVLLAQSHEVVAVDTVSEKVDLINQRKSPIEDKEIIEYLNTKQLNLRATGDLKEAVEGAEFAIIATPTNYDVEKQFFDTSSVDYVLKEIALLTTKTTVVIKSTIPVGYTREIHKQYPGLTVLFSPEFLREGHALYDNLYPARIIVGRKPADEMACSQAKRFVKLLLQGAKKENIPVLYVNVMEAEAIKLFANTYLAMRVAYFNELDTFAETKGLDTKSIVDGICLDPRIGLDYNNPSFGYGGYCLPKDTKQLRANYEGIPQNMMSAIVDSNETRMDYLANKIVEMLQMESSPVVGVYRLAMKFGSDNFRQSAMLGIMKRLKEHQVQMVLFEPMLEEEYQGVKVITDLDKFKKASTVIIANRYHTDLADVKEKLYTRDVFGRD